MNRAPRVTVGIPAYRSAPFISAAIDSVLQQRGVDLELLVIDDASDDGTWERIQAFDDPRIRALRNPQNIGAEANWNRCLFEATGDYFVLLPGDDLLYPDSLARRLEVLESDRSLAFCFTLRDIIDSRGRRVMTVRFFDEGRVGARRLLRRTVMKGTNVVGEPGCVMFRRELAEQGGGFSARLPYVTDLDYWTRLLARGDAWCIGEPLAAFRLSGLNWTLRLGGRRPQDFMQLIDRVVAMPYAGVGPLRATWGKARAWSNELLRVLFHKVVMRGR